MRLTEPKLMANLGSLLFGALIYRVKYFGLHLFVIYTRVGLCAITALLNLLKVQKGCDFVMMKIESLTTIIITAAARE